MKTEKTKRQPILPFDMQTSRGRFKKLSLAMSDLHKKDQKTPGAIREPAQPHNDSSEN